MSVEFIGFVGAREASESIAPRDGALNVDYVETSAKAHEASGFDRVLVAFHSTTPDSLLISQQIASVTRKLKLMVAHRPGFQSPTVTARQFATLDHLTHGRAGIHIITGGDDVELRQDGDFLTKDERYTRTDEYLEIVRKTWTEEKPFDYQGQFYRNSASFSTIKPLQKPSIPVYFGGASDAAIAVAAKHADIYALWGETLEQVKQLTSRVRDEAASHGRKPRFSVSFRPILAETEEKAWQRAADVLGRAEALLDKTGYRRQSQPVNEGSLRLLRAADQGSRLDRRLWTDIAKLTGAKGNSTALVGTPEQVAEAFLDYYDLGVTTFLIRGFDPLEDAIDYGRELIPLTRDLVARRKSLETAA